MAGKLVYEAQARVGKYKDREGNEKTRWHRCGVVIETEKGLSLKLEALPVSPEWDGWISFFKPKPKDDKKPEAAGTPSRPQPAHVQEDDDIPF